MKTALKAVLHVILLMPLLTVFPFTALAEVYKWTDASGRVHFSDKAPANRQAQTLNLPTAEPAPATPAPDDAERMARQQRLVKALEEERLEKERLKAEAKAEQEKRAAYCERFKNRLARMDSSSQIYSENQDGTVTYWSDQEADRYRREAKERYQQECGQATD